MDPYNSADTYLSAAVPDARPAPPALPAAAPANPYRAPHARVADRGPAIEDMEPAQRWMRLVAVLLDTAIVLVPTFMVASILASLRNPYAPASDGAKLVALLYLLGMGAYVIVQLVMLHRSGQTVGKRLMNIRIVRSDGSRAGLGRIFLLRSLLPNLIAAIPYLGVFFALIDVLFVFADDRRCLHDRFADTVVVDA